MSILAVGKKGRWFWSFWWNSGGGWESPSYPLPQPPFANGRQPCCGKAPFQKATHGLQMQHKSQTWPFIVPMIPSPVSQHPCSHTHPHPCLLGFGQASVCVLSLLTGTPWLIGTAPSSMEQGLRMLVRVCYNSAGACQSETGVMSASPLTAEWFEKISKTDIPDLWKGKKNIYLPCRVVVMD